MKFDSKYDVVFYEAFEEEEAELRNHLPGDKKYYFTWKTIQEAGHSNPPAPIISVRTQSIIPLEWREDIAAMITRSTGFDHIIDYMNLAEIDFPAAYLPDYAGRAVAEQAMLLWTALIRKLPEQQEAVKVFNRDGLTGKELVNKTIAIAGVGRIGSQIADIAKALKMKVLGVDIVPDKKLGIKYVSMAEGVAQADIFVCALPLTDITRGLLNYDLLKNLPKGAIFVNIARGEISPPEDILHLMREGIIGGIGLDVYDSEKELVGVLRDGKDKGDIDDLEKLNSVAATLELINHPHVITTPHNAFNTVESVERKALQTAENLVSFIEKGEFLSPVIK